MPFLIVFAVAFLLALAITPLTTRLGERLGIVALPGGRRQHQRAISKLGGIALYVAFVAAVGVSQVVPRLFPETASTDANEPIRLVGLLAGGTLLFIVGLVDDRFELPAWPQFVAQGAAAVIAIVCLIFVEYVYNPFRPDQPVTWPFAFTVALTLFWIIGMINTVNWLDGVDGLAAGVSAIAAVMMFVNAAFRLVPPQTSVSLLPLALAGACLGFLAFNFSPARVFMGSSGALFLGFTLGTLSIIGGAKVATVLLVMGAPILDVAWQIVRRLREGHNPVVGDRGHLHFRLVDLGIPPRVIVVGYYAFAAAFGLLTLLLPSALYKIVALMGLGAAVILVMIRVSQAGKSVAETTKDVQG